MLAAAPDELEALADEDAVLAEPPLRVAEAAPADPEEPEAPVPEAVEPDPLAAVAALPEALLALAPVPAVPLAPVATAPPPRTWVVELPTLTRKEVSEDEMLR